MVNATCGSYFEEWKTTYCEILENISAWYYVKRTSDFQTSSGDK